MPRFLPNQTIETSVPVVTVDAGLQPGRHRLQLVVAATARNWRSVCQILVQAAGGP